MFWYMVEKKKNAYFPIRKNSKYTFSAVLDAVGPDGLFSDILNKGNTLHSLV
jgi:hypothetical protein